MHNNWRCSHASRRIWEKAADGDCYHRSLARILLCVIVLIVYGSLYPWHFVHRYTGNPFWLVLHSWSAHLDRFLFRDLLLNIALYLPVGFFGSLTFRRSSAAVRLAAPLLLGMILSFCVEVAQVYDAGRNPNAVDVVANTFGCAAGVLLAAAMPHLVNKSTRRVGLLVTKQPAAAAIMALLLAYRLFPFFPVLGRYGLARKWRALSHAPFFLPSAFLAAMLTWFVAGRILLALGAKNPLRWLVWGLLLIPAEFFILSRQPTIAELLGAFTGIGAFVAFGRNAPASALTVVTLLVARGLMPFHLQAEPNQFVWIPFAGTLESNWQRGAGILIEKFFFYGAAVWSLRSARLTLSTAAILTAATLACVEIAQLWLPGRTPEITDPFIALLTAGAIYSLEPGRQQRG